MRNIMSFRWLLLLAACITAVHGSEEEFLAWQAVTVKCANEKTPAGPVSCEIAQKDAEYSSFTVRAFDKEFKLSAEDLAKLKGFPLSSLSTRHEAGYPQLGGYSVHFRFQRVVALQRKTLTEVIYVTATQNGVKVSDVRKN